MIRIQKNKDVFKYYISDMPNYFWRHELLKVSDVDANVPKLFALKESGIYENAVPKPKPKPKPKKKPGSKKLNFNIDQSNIVKRPRRKKKVNYAQFY